MSRKPTSLTSLIKYLHRHPHLELHHPGGVKALPEPTVSPRRFSRFAKKELTLLLASPDGATDEYGYGLPVLLESDVSTGGPQASLAFFDDRFEASVYSTRYDPGSKQLIRTDEKPIMTLRYYYRDDGPLKVLNGLHADLPLR